MKKLMILISLVFCFYVSATPLIVEQVKGRKATVYIPPNVDLKPGDSLYTEADCANNFCQQRPSTVMDSPPAQHLHERNHHISLAATSGIVSLPASTDLGGSQSAVDLTYGYGYGYFQPQLETSFGYTTSNATSVSAVTSLSTLGIRANLVKDAPGNNWIPFLAMGLGYFAENYNNSGSNLAAYGPAYGGSAGLCVYPLGELFSLDLSFHYYVGDLKMSGSGSGPVNATLNGFSLGTTLAF